MPYSLLGLFGRDLSEAHQAVTRSQLIELPQRITLLPLTQSMLESFVELPHTQYFPDTFSNFLSANVATRLGQLTKRTFAYLEIDCEGGSCQRSAALFVDGWPTWMASEDERAQIVFGATKATDSYISCTNLALRLIGVQSEPPNDELATLGLTEPPFRQAWENFEHFSLTDMA